MPSDRSGRGRTSLVGPLLIAVALAAAACGGGQDGGSSGGGSSDSQAAVQAAQAAAEKSLAAPTGWRSYPCHMMCRARHITHYENLANLGELPGRRFTFIGFPLRIRGGHGGPTRAVAVVDD